MRQSELDRRTFVMGSFGFGMAVLGGGMLAGCVAAEEQVEENEAPAPDEEGGPATRFPSPSASRRRRVPTCSASRRPTPIPTITMP